MVVGWVILAMILVLFTYTNWTTVPINLWAGRVADVNLPLLVIVAFLAGSVPFWLLHRATRWSMNRKLVNAERALAATVPPPPPAPTPGLPGTVETTPGPL
jgi:uncharacterized integral membrane protein